MSHLAQLKNVSSIISAEPVDTLTPVAALYEPKVRKNILKQLKQVGIYRIVYKVKKLHVVGYIAIPQSGTDLPCLIHLRGGSRDFGMIQPRGIIRNLLYYAAEGYVVITTQYPGVEGGTGADTFGGPDDIASILKLRDILKALPQADSTNIGLKGHSRGGLMVFMLLRQVRWIKAAMIAGAPTDQVDRAGDRARWREHQIDMWGGSIDESTKRSPIRWVGELSKKVPLLIMHGSADWRVLPRHSFNLLPLLHEHAIPFRFILFEGADHALTEHRHEYHAQTLDWFNRFLKNKEPLPNLKPHGD